MCKKFEKPWSTQKAAWASEIFFSREGGNSRFFQVVAKGIFLGGPTVVKFHYTNSKESDKHFSTKTLIGKYQISNSVGGLLSRFFVCWRFVVKLWYFIFADWTIKHVNNFIWNMADNGLPYLRYVPGQRGGIDSSVAMGTLVGLAYPNKAPSPPNWNRKHYKSVKSCHFHNVKPSCTNVEPPIESFLATVLGIECSNPWIDWVLRRCPWNGHKNSLLERWNWGHASRHL